MVYLLFGALSFLTTRVVKNLGISSTIEYFTTALGNGEPFSVTLSVCRFFSWEEVTGTL